MTTAQTQLEGWTGNAVALSFVIEGFGTVFATQALPGAFSGSAAPYNQWSDPTYGSLMVSGQLSQGIKLYTPDIEPSTITVSVSDRDGVLLSPLFRSNASSGHLTFLTSSVAAGSTSTWNVSDTTGFAASGTLYCGSEAVAYTGKTGTTFTGITRASFGVNLTDSSARFSPSHLIGNNVVASARTAPAVTDYPRTWYGRFCHLLVHVKDPLTGVFSTASNALKIASGRIENYNDAGGGIISIEFKSASDLLYKQIGPDQWSGSVNSGAYLDSDLNDAVMVERSGGATQYQLMKLASFQGPYEHDEIAGLINYLFENNTWDTSSALLGGVAIDAQDTWAIELVDPGDGGPQRYQITMEDSGGSSSGDRVQLALHPLVFALLGFCEPDEANTVPLRGAGGGRRVFFVELKRGDDDDVFEAMAPKPPIIYYSETPSTNPPITMEVTDEINTFVAQTPADFQALADSNGCIQISGGRFDGGIYAVKYTSGSPSTVVFHASLNSVTGGFWNVPSDNIVFEPVRLGDAQVAPRIRQVLYYRGPAGTLLLRMMLSSGGASGYNHADYDTLTTAGFGAGIPASLIDVDSFKVLDQVLISIAVSDPKPFYEFLEPILAVSGHYVVWKASSASTQPKLTVIRPSLDSVYQSTWHMTESNKCDSARTKASVAADGIINRIVVKYGQNPTKTNDGATTLTVEDIPSQTDYGRRRTITISATPVLNVPEVVSQTISPALTYFSRPIATAERSFNYTLMRMAPGDSVTLTDLNLVDPATGTRGATLYAWCLDTRFDLATGKGQARVVWLPEKNVNYTGVWGPSARVDETAGGSGYSGDGSKILTLKAHEYSDSSSATADAARFVVGYKFRVRQLDATAPITWTDTVASQSGNTITGTAGSGGLWDATKRWVVEYDDYAAVTTTQKQSAFFDAGSDHPYEWGFRTNPPLTPVKTFSQGWPRSDSWSGGAGDAPVSVHHFRDVGRGINNYLGYRSRSVHLNEDLGAASGGIVAVGTTPKLVFMSWVPIYGHVSVSGTRGLKFRLRIYQSGGGIASFHATSSANPPVGSSFTSFNYPGGYGDSLVTTNSATPVWTSETDLTCVPSASGPGGMNGTWITIYASGSTGGTSAFVTNFFLCEAGL